MMNRKNESEAMKHIKDFLISTMTSSIKDVQKHITSFKVQIKNIEVTTCYPSELALNIVESSVVSLCDLKHTIPSKIMVLASLQDVKFMLHSMVESTSTTHIDEFELQVYNQLIQALLSHHVSHVKKQLNVAFDVSAVDSVLIDQKNMGFSPFESKLIVTHVTVLHHSKECSFSVYYENNVLSALLDSVKVTSQENVKVKEVRLPKFVENKETNASQSLQNLDLILNVPLKVSVEIGQAKQKIKDIMSMGPGNVIELDKPIGAPVDIVVNGQRLARGEVVVIDENFAIRITEILQVSHLEKKE